MGLRAARRIEGAGIEVTAFPDITPDLKAAMPELRGRLLANQSLAELTWFRVGGPAQVLFTPSDEDDLAYFLSQLPRELAVYVVGVGSNLIVRDGGMPGVVIRLSPRGFGETGADAELSGAVVAFGANPVTFDNSGRATEYEISITASILFKRVGKEQVLWKNERYNFRESYPVEVSNTGYFDQAHLAREFRALAGLPPSQWLAEEFRNVQGGDPGHPEGSRS